MTSDLRESVARAIYDALEGPVNNQDYARQVAQWNRAIEIADAAIAIVLEEAARVVRRMPSPSSEWMADELLRALCGPANQVPEDIRALKNGIGDTP